MSAEDCARCGEPVGDAHLRTVTATESAWTCLPVIKRVQDMTDEEITVLLLDAEDSGYQRALREHGLGGYDGLLSQRVSSR